MGQASVCVGGHKSDPVLGDATRKWGLVRDFKLMGHEHGPPLDDARFERLVKTGGLLPRWRPMAAYLASLGVTDEELGRLARAREGVFGIAVDRARGRVEFLAAFVGLVGDDLRRVVVKHPRVLEYRIERTMQPRLAFLEGLGLDAATLPKVITRAPMLLELSVEGSLAPRVDYLVRELGIARSDVAKVIAREPQVLTHSIAEMVAPRVAFLRSLGLSAGAVARIVTRHPQVLHYAIESMQPRIAFLQSIGMGEEAVVNTVTRLAQIFSLDVEHTLRPKFEYLTAELGGTAATVESYPAYFSLSLPNRIIPRHRFLVARDLMPAALPMKALSLSDEAFALRCAKSSLRAFEAFKADLGVPSAA